FTRYGVDRVLRFAFELAAKRPRRKLTSATKSNGIFISMPYWDERVADMQKAYPQVQVDKFHIDILTAHFVRNPDWFDVVVASNLFGDILSDLGPACTGTIGIAPSANINPERLWSAALMLDHLGYPQAHDAIVKAIETVTEHGPRTPDMGGKAKTGDIGKAVIQALS
ncbi:MAG: hypothetical protein RLZZ613_1764, partial [Pseudomonadota bacterium]